MPPRARSNFDYTQTAIGDCGHVTEAWPVTGKHNFERGRREDWVFCDTCTVLKYGLVDVDGKLAVYVRLVEKNPRGRVETELAGGTPKKKAPRKATPKKAAPKKVNPWEQLLTTKDIGDVSGET